MSDPVVKESPKVVDLKPQAKPQRLFRAKIEVIDPTFIVSVWEMFAQALRSGNVPYPDISEEQPEKIQAMVFEYLKLPSVFGLIAKAGKKPIGLLLGDVRTRPFGKPSIYFAVTCLWVSPSYRNKGVLKSMIADAGAGLKKNNVFYWEGHAAESVCKDIVKSKELRERVAAPLYMGLGGKL